MSRGKQTTDASGNKTTRFEQDKLIAANFVRMQNEHRAMAERLKEMEEVSKDKVSGKLYWSSCGKFIDGSGDVSSGDDEEE